MRPTTLAVGAATAAAAVFGVVGADSRWAAALGDAVARSRTIPDGVPFAAAPTHGWPNVPVLGELILAGFASALGERGFVVAQVAAVAAAFALLAAAMRRAGATETGAACALLLATVGAFPSLAVARLQLFSLPLFALLLLLLQSESRQPSRRIWAVPALIAVWSNLHGAVLVGLAVAAAHLLIRRVRIEPGAAFSVLAASVLAVCATPALARTPGYYVGVAQSEAARRGLGLWAPLGLRPYDLILVCCAAALVGLAVRTRPQAWEAVALVGLVALTVHTARSGIWLLMLAAIPAGRGIHARVAPRPATAAAAATALVVLTFAGVVRGPAPAAAGREIIDRATAEAAGGPILAQDVLAEQVATAGGTVWVGNPLDAFTRADQRLYLEWATGRGDGAAALDKVRVVLVHPQSRAQSRLAAAGGFKRVEADADAVLYVRSDG